jgi:hypothetical protein
MANLVKWETSVPLRAIPEERLNAVLSNEFADWLCGLLSLTDDTSAERLVHAIQAIKKQFWSMGFVEIKKAFELYADSQLDVKPIPNYLDRIQVGKIFEAYRHHKPKPKPKPIQIEISDEEKEALVYMGVINCFEQFLQDRKIIVGYTWVYGHLFDDLKLKSFTTEEKKMAVKKAKANKEKSSLFQKVTESEHDVKNRAKRMLLKEYFESLEEQELHIKDLL